MLFGSIKTQMKIISKHKIFILSIAETPRASTTIVAAFKPTPGNKSLDK